MFGSILAMSNSDVILSIIVSVLYIIYYRKLFIVNFDEEFAKISGLYFSYTLNISTGAMIVIVNLFIFVILTIISKIIEKKEDKLKKYYG